MVLGQRYRTLRLFAVDSAVDSLLKKPSEIHNVILLTIFGRFSHSEAKRKEFDREKKVLTQSALFVRGFFW